MDAAADSNQYVEIKIPFVELMNGTTVPPEELYAVIRPLRISSERPDRNCAEFSRSRPGLELPKQQTMGAAGVDLLAALGISETVTIASGARAIVPCGFAMALPQGYEAQVRPRSGLAAKHGVTVLNAPGTIDADYRGEVKVILINHGSESVRNPARRQDCADGGGAGERRDLYREGEPR